MSLDPALYPPIPPVEGDAPRPFWSVIVPAYKSKYLSQALHSVVDQAPARERMEVLVINDCSPEDLDPIVREAGGDRVTYIRQPVNRGTYPTENAGVTMSRGQWIHILNDDDWVLPGFYEAFEKSLERAPQTVGAAYCGFTHYSAEGEEYNTPPGKRGSPGVLANFIEQVGVSNVLHPIAAIFRRECFEKLGGFNLNLNYCADWEFNKRVALHYDWWYEPRVMACYRMNPGNVSSGAVQTAQQLRDLKYAIELTQRLLPPDMRDRITKTSRDHYAIYALRVAGHMVQARRMDAALRQLKAGMALSRSPEVRQKLLKLIQQPWATPLLDVMMAFFEHMELDPPADQGGDPKQSARSDRF